jgi:hypothetical protein
MRSIFRWKVFGPIGLIVKIIVGLFVLRLAADPVLQRAEERRRNGRARNNGRVDSRDSMAGQRKAGSVYDDVMAAREQVEFIGPSPK